ncbi:hypothetical protein [Burkholderia gladioli]|uniref:hypothetical protein n=1 Tax=Burkholderia gladioli TaxID=28095 RepID=UPI0034DAFA43
MMLNFAAPVAEPPSRTAARQFQQKFQQAALDAPGSVRASRHDLGLSEHRLTMIDIGGEGQKTEDGEELMRSGNAHAINVNAQTVGSPGEFYLQAEPGGQPQKTSHFEIPNLVRPAKSWPGPGEKAEGLLPFADGFSSVTMTEGAPVFGYHVNEMSRVTSKKGWMMLAVDESFEDRIGELAQKHNGDGTVWSFPPKDGTMNRYVIPPKAALEGGPRATTRRCGARRPRMTRMTWHRPSPCIRPVAYRWMRPGRPRRGSRTRMGRSIFRGWRLARLR